LSELGIDVTGIFEALKSVAESVFGAIDKVICGVVGTIQSLIGWAKEAWDWLSKLWGGGEEDKTKIRVDSKGEEVVTGVAPGADMIGSIGAFNDFNRDYYAKQGKKWVPEEEYAKLQTKAEFEAKQAAESGGASQPQPAATPPAPPAAPPAATTTTPPFTAASEEVQDRPLVTEATRAGKVETKNITNQQNNNVNIKNNMTITGSGDPEETANRTAEKLDDAIRYIPPAIASDTAYGGAG
jgi:hypothetical protein